MFTSRRLKEKSKSELPLFTQSELSSVVNQTAANGQTLLKRFGPLQDLLVVESSKNKLPTKIFNNEKSKNKGLLDAQILYPGTSFSKRLFLKLAGVSRVIQPDTQLPFIQSTFFEKNLNGNPNIHIFGLCDGIGEQGWQIAGLVSQYLQEKVKSSLSITKTEVINKGIVVDLMEKIFEECKEMMEDTQLNMINNGCTCMVVLIVENLVYSVNSGDSRLFIGSHYLEGFTVQSLTKQHTLNNPEEYNRIKAHETNYNLNNRAEAEERYDIPLTRSFGCYELAHIGMTCRPEVKVFKLTAYDKFLFLASQSLSRLMAEKACLEFVYEDMRKGNNLEKASDRLKLELRERQRTSSTHEEITFVLIKMGLQST